MTDDNGMETANVLLVDDNPRNLKVLAAVLESPDHNLVLATSGREALAHLLEKSFAVVVLDVMMPEMDGFELARLIKTRKKTENVPIIFLTAFHTEERDVFQGYALGAFDYLIKPAHPHVLRAKVAVFVDLFRKFEAERRQYEYLADLAGSGKAPVDPLPPRWEAEYRDVLVAHVRALRLKQPPPSRRMRALARSLVAARARTRDVVGAHVRAIKEISHSFMLSDAEVFGIDARLCLLEMLGNLTDLYEEEGKPDADPDSR